MTRNEYRSIIAQLGLSQIGAARFLGIGKATTQRWAAGGVGNEATIMLLRLMVALQLSPESVEKLLRDRLWLTGREIPLNPVSGMPLIGLLFRRMKQPAQTSRQRIVSKSRAAVGSA